MTKFLMMALTFASTSGLAATTVFDCNVNSNATSGSGFQSRIVVQSEDANFLVPEAVSIDVLSGSIMRRDAISEPIGADFPQKAFGPLWVTVRHLQTTFFITDLPADLNEDWKVALIEFRLHGSDDPTLGAIVLDNSGEKVFAFVQLGSSRRAIECR